jgi:predicted RND superfamily exporter protein
VRSMILVLSLVLGILPLLGIAGVLANGMITTVDGMFMILILLTLSAVFFLNAYWEMRDSGLLGKKTAAAAPAKTAAPKAS